MHDVRAGERTCEGALFIFDEPAESDGPQRRRPSRIRVAAATAVTATHQSTAHDASSRRWVFVSNDERSRVMAASWLPNISTASEGTV